MKIKYCLLFFLIITTATHCQYKFTRAKLILKNGDTLIGYAKIPRLSKDLSAINFIKKVRYRKFRKSKKSIKYDEKDLEKIIFKNKKSEVSHYTYLKVSKKKYSLFKVVVSGKATLFQRDVRISNNEIDLSTLGNKNDIHSPYKEPFLIFKEYYVLRQNEKIGSPLITTGISRSFRKRAIEYFFDCPKVIKKLKNRTYKKKNVRDLVTAYNKCDF